MNMTVEDGRVQMADNQVFRLVAGLKSQRQAWIHGPSGAIGFAYVAITRDSDTIVAGRNVFEGKSAVSGSRTVQALLIVAVACKRDAGEVDRLVASLSHHHFGNPAFFRFEVWGCPLSSFLA